MTQLFTANGKPFFPIGAQACNSSGYNEAEWATAFQAVETLHGNTLEIPVYWEQIEPQEGHFDFSELDWLLTYAHLHEIKLVLLWFATWKNGKMNYAPGWVKTDARRFDRVITPSGNPLFVLSSHCQANFDADHAAFCALCAHLKQIDSDEQTVIAVQIENEPGILGCDRDYGPDGEAQFQQPAPMGLVSKMEAAGRGRVFDCWQENGGRGAGTWAELFGPTSGEMMTAWSIARYIDRLAEAGKAILDIPMYVNVWLGEESWRMSGETYPSGGAVGRVLDLYKWYSPHLDLVAPDIYVGHSRGFEAICNLYTRHDNPLFVPESAPGGANVWNMFRAIGDFGAIGYAFFSAESIIAADSSPRPESQPLIDSFRCVAAAAPLLLKFHGSGKVHTVLQEENQLQQTVNLDGWLALAEFSHRPPQHVIRDWRHAPQLGFEGAPSSAERARGLVIQASKNEIYAVGANYHLVLRPKLLPEQARDVSVANGFLLLRLGQYVSIDEGHFEEGIFKIDRRRNGDETDHGLWVEPDCGVVRVIMCE